MGKSNHDLDVNNNWIIESHANISLKTSSERIEYKLLSLTYKVLTTSQPDYLHNLISLQSSGRTRSSSVVTLARPSVSSSLQITNAKRSFYHAFNSLFGKIGRIASEDVIVQLLETKCLPVLYYCLEACPLRKYQLIFTRATLCHSNVSVRLSVRHAPVLCQNEESVMISSPSGSPATLVSWR